MRLTVLVVSLHACLSGCGLSATGAQSIDATECLTFELASPKCVYGKQEEIGILLRISNASRRSIRTRVPYKWIGTNDYFAVLKDGLELENLMRMVDFFYTRVTVLRPGESVTSLFALREIAKIPDPADRAGTYTVGLVRSIAEQQKSRRWLFLVSNLRLVVDRKDVEPLFTLTDVESEADVEFAKAILRSPAVQPADKARVLGLLATYGDGRALWDGFSSLLAPASGSSRGATAKHQCMDVYAAVTSLEKIPDRLLTSEGLFTLAETTDLALRRASLKALSRLEPNAQVAQWLAKFLQTQEDEYTLEVGREVLTKLRSSGR
jgi:hypothetical protein